MIYKNYDIGVPKEVAERLEKHNFSVQLVKRRHVKDVLSQAEIDRLSLSYNTENMYLEFAVLTQDVESEHGSQK